MWACKGGIISETKVQGKAWILSTLRIDVGEAGILCVRDTRLFDAARRTCRRIEQMIKAEPEATGMSVEHKWKQQR